MLEIKSPFPFFTDLSGQPLDAGYVYIGTSGTNPVTNAIAVYWDSAGTQAAAQPLRTVSGYISRNGTPARIYISADTCSLSVYDSRSALVLNASSIASATVALGDLADIATNTLIGRSTAGTGSPELITCTAAGRAILDDADAAAQRTTLSVYSQAQTYTQAEVDAIVSAVPAFVNGRMSISGADLKLSRYNGVKIPINGTLYTIPAAGVTLSTSGVSANSTYYIYAYYSAPNIVLEFSGTVYALDTTTGLPIKNGDSTRSLVGMARTNGASAWSIVRNYFNDPGYVSLTPLASDVAAPGGSSYVEVSTSLRTEFLVWSDETVEAVAIGALEAPSPSSNGYVSLGFDGTTAEDVYNRHIDSGSNCIVPINVKINKRGLSEGYHYATMLHYGEAKILGSATTGRRASIQVMLGRR